MPSRYFAFGLIEAHIYYIFCIEAQAILPQTFGLSNLCRVVEAQAHTSILQAVLTLACYSLRWQQTTT